MNTTRLKNIPFELGLDLKDLVEIQPGQVISKTLVQNNAVSITVFSFDKDEEISTHASDGDALVTVLEGTGRLTIDGVTHIVTAHNSIVMPSNKPHAVYAETAFKMLLVVVF